MKLRQRPKFWIYPYGASNAAIALAEALDGRVILRRNSRYRRQLRDLVINWGASSGFDNGPIINHPRAVKVATSKTATFERLAAAGVQVPAHTSDPNVARAWVAEGRVLGRDLDNGSQGRGIHVYEKGAALGPHRFYVKYVRKQREFRIHVMRGEVIFKQEKLKKNGVEDADKYVRSHHRGWCFAFHHLEEKPVPEVVLRAGVDAVRALGLDFGAVDIAWNERSGATVLEVNTAPGIEESSLVAYADAFQRLL